MTRPAFLVDGHMEQRITNRLCPGAPVRLINHNGRDVSISVIAKQVATLFRLFGNRYYPVVILIDREARKSTASEIKIGLRNELAKLEIPTDQIILGVADRMIENWILADSECHKCIPPDCPSEGVDGKSHLKAYLSKSGETYHETTVGVELFCAMDVSRAAGRSPSLREFAVDLRAYCSWAAQLSI